MFILIFLSAILSLENEIERHSLATENLNTGHVRFKRQVNIKNLSPSDRDSCKPGGTVTQYRVDTTQRLLDLRSKFNQNGLNLNGYIIPSEDAHQSEYPANFDKRRQFITGFEGSFGLAIVLKDKAALWTDGRYYLQAEQELDCNWILMKQDEPDTPTYVEWILANLGASSTVQNRNIGLNPYYMSSGDWISLETKLRAENIVLQPITSDLIDLIWQVGRPPRPSDKINSLSADFAGVSWQQKVTEIYATMVLQKVDAIIFTQLDEIAWLFNLRSSDVQFNPFFLSYALLETQTGSLNIRLFIWDKERKLTEQPSDPETKLRLDQHLNTGVNGLCANKMGMCVQVEDYLNFINVVTTLNSNAIIKRFWIPYQCNYAIYRVITKDKLQGNTPAALKKFQKNPTEHQGLRNAHKRDAVALITFLANLEKKVKDGITATEISEANSLIKYREPQMYYRGQSFPTISAYGSNSAIIHYTPTVLSNSQIAKDNMYLVDSGAHYLDGTTDVTRTLHFGEPNNYHKEMYTRVLMGHIDLARFIFYKGTYGPYGREIDAIARRPLWEVGLDYRHGTGHGVGAYLSVHEGPGRISLAHPRVDKDVPLDEFQVFSDEPGYYQSGAFGVRLENVVMITEAATKYKFLSSKFLGFETLTLVPYEPRLIDYSLLNTDQINWLNNYHDRVQKEIGPLIINDTIATEWLQKRTLPYITLSNNAESLKISLASLILTLCLIFCYS